MNTKLYPLKFQPILKDKIWGGNKLKTLLHKQVVTDTTGESWEISAVENSVSRVVNGALAGKSLTDLVEIYTTKLVGDEVFAEYGLDFPLLFKFIDAKENLSLQLHPNDKLSKKRHDSLGKTEMWYVMQADENAGIYVGFKKGTTKADYLHHLQNDSLQSIMNFEQVETGDVFYIRPGLVHAIGQGVFLAEIQQSSDITYRVFDWNRRDHNGKPRTLHTDLALEAIDFDFDEFKIDYNKQVNAFQSLVESKYFKTRKINLQGQVTANYENTGSFVVLMCVDGKVEIKTGSEKTHLVKGETLLLPACLHSVALFAENAQLLEISI